MSRGKPFELVIFDCDGVLIDSEILACRIDAEELNAIGYPITLEEVVLRFTGLPSGSMRAVVERDLGRPLPDNFEAIIRKKTSDAYRTDLTAIAGMAEFIDALDIPACVASSSAPDKLRYGLELTGLYQRFAPNVFSTTMVANGKPAPDLFLHAARTMGVEPDRCVVVEDSTAGVRAGVAAGMHVVGFTAGSHCGQGHGERLLEAGALSIASHPEVLATLFRSTSTVAM
ncbi:HAD superfamily hydrolase (TIGR01509 family) [Mesorhizobium robiniae]|uniref:HAD superfamily hydrolase (TIGR01509 family) n=1 Tax=Mesorhizobium robiniae TaxID=559315 RepID=A0ABV2GT47_9HYPH